MAKAFGMRTMGIRRGVEPIPDVDLTLRQDQLPLLLAESDAVLLATPLTPETTGLVDSAFLHSMKRTAVLINVARGKVVNTGALITALNEQVIAGAGLDVTDPEPLPAGHPLWHARNAIITPHHANPYRSSGMYPVRRFAENLRRYLAGESLLAIVDPERGY
jgi:phosphoglycerate dehydrogenase-like enzyme